MMQLEELEMRITPDVAPISPIAQFQAAVAFAQPLVANLTALGQQAVAGQLSLAANLEGLALSVQLQGFLDTQFFGFISDITPIILASQIASPVSV